MNTKAVFSMLVLTLGLGADITFAQPRLEFPAPSPTSTLKQRVGLTDIEIVYSRPSAKGRIVFGSLVPYGEVWRTGANNATRITFSSAMTFNGAQVPAGTYALYTIPGAEEWTVVLSKNTGLWGASGYTETDDLLRVKAKPVKQSERVETFTISIGDLRDESATLNLSWENVRVPIQLGAELTSKLVPQIEEVMASADGRKPYYPAAAFYFDHGQDLQKARKWVDAAIAEREAYYIVHLKAKILAKLGDKEGAIAAAKRSTELAKEAKDSAYVRLNETLIASLQ
jgi:hypothetical protein